MLLLVMLSVLGLLVLFPETPIARNLHRLLVQQPARRLAKLTPGRMAFWLALGLMGLVLFVLFEADGVRLFTFMAPDIVMWFTMFEVALFLDVFLIAAAMVATTRVRVVRDQVVQAVRRALRSISAGHRGRDRSPRSRPERPSKPPCDDPDPWASLSYAGYRRLSIS